MKVVLYIIKTLITNCLLCKYSVFLTQNIFSLLHRLNPTRCELRMPMIVPQNYLSKWTVWVCVHIHNLLPRHTHDRCSACRRKKEFSLFLGSQHFYHFFSHFICLSQYFMFWYVVCYPSLRWFFARIWNTRMKFFYLGYEHSLVTSFWKQNNNFT